MTRLFASSALMLLLVASGCTKDTTPAVSENNPNVPMQPAVAMNPGTVVGQPGANPALGVDLQNVGPEVVVDQFLRALQQGNRELVSSLLTEMARTETTKFGLEVQPESIPDSAFRIVQAAYLPEADPMATPTMAHVASLWSEDGGEEAYEIIWVLRKEQVGWRISAMGLTIDFNQDPLLLDFEHPEEMMKVRDQAMQDLANQPAEGVDPNGNPAEGAVPGTNGGFGEGNPAGVANVPTSPGTGNSPIYSNPPPADPIGVPGGSALRQDGPRQATGPAPLNNPIR